MKKRNNPLKESAIRAEEAGDFRSAFELWAQLAEQKKRPVHSFRLGCAAHRLEKWNDAEKAFKDALAMDPGSAFIMERLGFLFHKRKDGDQQRNAEIAKDWFLGALAVEQSAAVLSLLGVVYVKLGQIDAAREAFLQAIEIDSSYAEAYFNLAMLEEKNDLHKAKLLLEKAIGLDPDWNAPHEELARLQSAKI